MAGMSDRTAISIIIVAVVLTAANIYVSYLYLTMRSREPVIKYMTTVYPCSIQSRAPQCDDEEEGEKRCS